MSKLPTPAHPKHHTSESATTSSEIHGLNIYPPPISLPKLCCFLLPLFSSLPLIKAYNLVVPKNGEAELLRNGRWVVYDREDCVVGDIVRIYEGGIIPADCNYVGGSTEGGKEKEDEEGEDLVFDTMTILNRGTVSYRIPPISGETITFYSGTTIRKGPHSIICRVSAVGVNTKLGNLLKKGEFPVKSEVGGGGGGYDLEIIDIRGVSNSRKVSNRMGNNGNGNGEGEGDTLL